MGINRWTSNVIAEIKYDLGYKIIRTGLFLLLLKLLLPLSLAKHVLSENNYTTKKENSINWIMYEGHQVKYYYVLIITIIYLN